MNTNTQDPTTHTHGTPAPISDTSANIAEIHDYYVAQVNSLVAEDREWMIPSLTAEYDQIVEQAQHTRRAA